MRLAPLAALFAVVSLNVASANPLPLAVNGAWTTLEDVASQTKMCGIQIAANGGKFTVFGTSDRQGVLRIGLLKSAWHINGIPVPIVIKFADDSTFNFTGYGSGQTIRADVPDSQVKSFIHHLTADDEATLTLPEGNEAPWALDLSGTTPAVVAMAPCIDAAQIVLPPPLRPPQPIETTSSALPSPGGAGKSSQPSDENSQPNWKAISKEGFHTDYIDTANISRNGNFATIWHLQDFNNPPGKNGQPIALGAPGHEFLSIKFEIEFDCSSGMDAPKFYASFTGHMGSGSLVEGGPEDQPWKQVAAGEKMDQDMACNSASVTDTQAPASNFSPGR
jgi:hypothetical protein